MAHEDRWYRRVGWASLWFTVVVILGGSVVRASGSGAGCGESWPRCNGSLIPLGGDIETVIEFTHRLFTGALGIALFTFGAWTWRRIARFHPVRRALKWAAIFFVGEVVIGALLVTFGWVDDDTSLGRLIAVPIHLVNTFFLLGALAAAAFHAGRPESPVRWPERRTKPLVLAAMGVVLVIAAMGALNALADTLYPDDSLASGIAADPGGASPLLVQLRVLHPVIAIIGGLALVWLVRHPAFDPGGRAATMRHAVSGIVFLQFVVGMINVALLTPIEVQVMHLLVADVLWILVVLAGLTISTRDVQVAPEGALVR